MTRKSKRELEREIEQAREEVTPDPEFNITSEVTVIMERETAQREDREIFNEVRETTRIATWYDEDGNIIGGSPEQRVPEETNLAEVVPGKDGNGQ